MCGCTPRTLVGPIVRSPPPGTYLLTLEEEATFCSSRKRTSRACGWGSPGERSSEPLLHAPGEGCAAGTRERGAGEGQATGLGLTPGGFAEVEPQL